MSQRPRNADATGSASATHSSSGHASSGHASSGHASSGHASSGHASSGHLPSNAGALHTSHAIPIGSRVEAILEIAYRARRPVLLEGSTGIGKSELIAGLSQKLGVGFQVLDLSLLEPPDLVGLPVIEEGRTRYAVPSFLPTEGEGILLLEELNRAERYIQQPALQLLTARALHQYVLPDGWACFAAINPENGDYHVTPMDPALRARFLQVRVRPDRASWLVWAGAHGVHPAILNLARNHERIFEQVPPRSWTYASRVLAAMKPHELSDESLVRDVLGGYLPPVWVEALANQSLSAKALDFDVYELLRGYTKQHSQAIQGWKQEGDTDRLDELVARLNGILRGPECGVLIAKQELVLSEVEALFADLPGDQREMLQESLGSNPTAITLLDVKVDDVLINYSGSGAQKKVAEWKTSPGKHHRISLLVTAIRARISKPHVAAELRKANAPRISLGHLLAQLGERWGMPLAETMHRVGITPIRPQ